MGANYPMEHSEDGNFTAPGNDEAEVETVIRVILDTIPGQHPRLPEFGNHAIPLLFENPGPGCEAQISGFLKHDIERWEPRVKVLGVDSVFDYNKALYHVTVTWIIPGSGRTSARQISIALGGERRV